MRQRGFFVLKNGTGADEGTECAAVRRGSDLGAFAAFARGTAMIHTKYSAAYLTGACLTALCSCSGSASGPPPVLISSATPGVIQGGDNNVAWMLNGSGFMMGAVVTVDLGGVTVTDVTYVSATQVTFMLSASTNTVAGTAQITLTNPDMTSGQTVVPTVPQNITLSADVQPIFTQSCARVGCHSGGAPAAELDLTAGATHGATVGVASVQVPSLPRVAAGDPDASYLVDKIEGTQTVGGMMPANKAPLTGTEQMLIRRWIEAGALNN